MPQDPSSRITCEQLARVCRQAMHGFKAGETASTVEEGDLAVIARVRRTRFGTFHTFYLAHPGLGPADDPNGWVGAATVPAFVEEAHALLLRYGLAD